MRLSAVIPTIDGREALLEQTIQSLSETADGHSIELVVVRNAPTIGQAWNQGAQESTGEYLWLGADDVTLCEGWIDAAASVDYPVPRIVCPDGSLEACGTLGQGGKIDSEVVDGFPCNSSQFPFIDKTWWEDIGPVPPIHYYADDYLGWKARYIGLLPTLVRGYTITHYEGTVGRGRQVARAMQDRQTFLTTIAKEHSCLVAS